MTLVIADVALSMSREARHQRGAASVPFSVAPFLRDDPLPPNASVHSYVSMSATTGKWSDASRAAGVVCVKMRRNAPVG
jgi:hypothetical protein